MLICILNDQCVVLLSEINFYVKSNNPRIAEPGSCHAYNRKVRPVEEISYLQIRILIIYSPSCEFLNLREMTGILKRNSRRDDNS